MQQSTGSPTTPFSEYLTIAQAADFLGVSTWTLRNWDRAGRLKPSRHPVNGYRMYRHEDLEKMLLAGDLRPGHRWAMAPRVDWNEIGETEHFVQFYESDAYLVESVTSYVQKGLSAGDAALVIATRAHRDRLLRKLRTCGIDVAAAEQHGQLVVLDASETLARLMRDGKPVPELFSETVGRVMAACTRKWPRVRAFGEMVALLWADGKHEAACALEALWNDLAGSYDFMLFCAYPLPRFGGTDGHQLDEICASHSRVLPAESYARLATADEQLRAITILQQKAQALETEIAQRRQAQRELSDFVENAAEGLHKVNADGMILWANKAELEMLGYAPAEYIGHHVAEFHVDRDVAEHMLSTLLKGENLINFSARLRCKDGSTRDVLVHSNAYFEDGRFIYSRCFTRDVTDIRAAEQGLAFLASIVESSDDAIVTKSLDGVIRSWNKGAERLFGYAAEEAIGRPITLIIPADMLDEERQILAQLRRNERIDHYETRRLTKDGRLIDVSLTVSPVRDGSGRIIGASKVARDITSRRSVERALRESQERFSRFMQFLPGLAWIKDAAGSYVYANHALTRPFGISPAELSGRTDHDLFPPEAAAQFAENDRRALASGAALETVESFTYPDGVRQFLVCRFPILTSGGQLDLVGGVAIDITDRLRAEQALRDSDRRKDEFLATLAHELRNPLAPIRNGLHVLRMTGQNGHAGAHVCDMIERQVRHMVRLVNDLLEISRINRGKIELEKQRVDLASVIQHSVETSKPAIEAAGHALDISLPSEPVFIEADPVRMAQVFSNLLNNAAKYTDPGGKISLTCERDGSDVVVTVSDNGIGIPPNMLSRVFEMFARVENPLMRSTDGLGIGLSLARTLVAMHGGSITARSQGLGKGSRFAVRIPSIEAGGGGSENAESLADGLGDGLSLRRILIVDDNKDSADSLAMFLGFLGADVHVAYDGVSATEKLRVYRPSVAILDLGLPGMDGCELARHIRADPETANTLLIALTGWGQEEDRRRSEDAGFDHHLVKPVDLPALQTLLAAAEDGTERPAGN